MPQALAAANRVREESDLALIRQSLPGVELVAVPDDARIAQADRDARSPIDVDADAPAVRAVAELANRLMRVLALPRGVALPMLD
jgi:hypothetical protein